jgi:hypothetical protein
LEHDYGAVDAPTDAGDEDDGRAGDTGDADLADELDRPRSGDADADERGQDD